MAKRELRLARLLKRLAIIPSTESSTTSVTCSKIARRCQVLFTLLAERYERGSIILTSNLPFSKWEKIFKVPHDDGRGDRPARAPQHHPGTQRCELSNRAIEEEQGESGQDAENREKE